MNEVKDKICNFANLVTTSALTAVENKIASVNNFVKKKKKKKMAITQKLIKLERKLLIIIMITILLFQNFISFQKKFLA